MLASPLVLFHLALGERKFIMQFAQNQNYRVIDEQGSVHIRLADRGSSSAVHAP